VSTKSAGHRKARRIRPPDICLVLLAVLSLAACVTEKSADSRLSGVMHKCFRTTGDAVLYQSNKCPPMGGMATTSTCLTVKNLSDLSPPATLSDFDHGAASIADRLTPSARRALLIPNPDVSVIGPLTQGTSLTIEGMHRFSHPEQGSIWITTAKILDGQFAGQTITLPWDDLYLQFHGDGAWIKDFVQRDPFIRDPYRPQIDSKVMIPCEIPEKAD
jgi:hypothetical protein